MYLNQNDKDYITNLLNNRLNRMIDNAKDLNDQDRKDYFDYNEIEYSLLCDLLSQFENGLTKTEIKNIYHKKGG